MKFIPQQEENDCGVACVAMLAGVSYAEGRAVIYAHERSKLTKTKNLNAALMALGRRPLSTRRQPLGFKTLDDRRRHGQEI